MVEAKPMTLNFPKNVSIINFNGSSSNERETESEWDSEIERERPKTSNRA